MIRFRRSSRWKPFELNLGHWQSASGFAIDVEWFNRGKPRRVRLTGGVNGETWI